MGPTSANTVQSAQPEPDIVVVGGGPAGSTAAAFLAAKGRRVVLVEKGAHPRFHIGESLLPRNLDIFERLGVLEEVRAIGVHKPGAEFASDRTGRTCPFPFAAALDRDRTYSWQVRRSELDELLFKNAIRKGATAFQETRVTDIQLGKKGERSRVTAKGKDGEVMEWHPRYVLDASGRDTFLASRMDVKVSNKYNNTAAIYGHFEGVLRREGELEGYIGIHLAEDGWFWLIPLRDGLMSIGFVGNQSAWKNRTGTPTELFMSRIASSLTVSERTQNAKLVSEVFSTANYSYRARQGNGEGFLMIGDAYGFVDPMFSTGVLMAMTAGELGAEAAHTWLDNPAKGQRLADRTNRELGLAMDRIGWLIYRINDPVMRTMFMSPTNKFWMRDGIVNLLAGNLRGSLRATLPILCFKTAYYLMIALRKRGMGRNLPEETPEASPLRS